ncbi:hypothetical protein HELRODRAFT_192173 [Helobdella robusta]|uniref:IgGFc-binding protein N-terminal domain-containing protein n=1 Tax=Helobdella robusta TaxID=6412 RepID=T1FTN5_HELRO|nr:hypothetical protein HELRODRAFT_192173 [Helobdella robusta]ESO01498.1 hypothetical protein HELRODRAFT_192173 [Helobdella robusta]
MAFVKNGDCKRGVAVLICSLMFIIYVMLAAVILERETGRNFSLLFMENNESSLTHRLEIYPAYRFNRDVDLKLTWSAYNLSLVNITTLVGGPLVVAVPGRLELNMTERAWKSIKIEASDKIGVYAMNRHEGTCDGFMVLPHHMLGTKHYVVCYFPENKQTQLAFASVESNTTVVLSLRAATRPSLVIRWNNLTYRGGSNITFNLDRDETVQIKSNGDLTGCGVFSDKPIAVFSGNDLTKVAEKVDIINEDNLTLNYLVEQIPDVSHWGTRFYLAPFISSNNSDSSDYQVKIVCSNPGTNIVLYLYDQPSSIFCSNSGDSNKTFIPYNKAVSIHSNYPILVAQIFGSTFTRGPSMAIITPVEKFNSFYTFSTAYSESADIQFNHYIHIVSTFNETKNLRLNDREIAQSIKWSSFTDNSTYVWCMLQLREGLQAMHNSNKMQFGVTVLGDSKTAKYCSYAYSAGLCS